MFNLGHWIRNFFPSGYLSDPGSNNNKIEGKRFLLSYFFFHSHKFNKNEYNPPPHLHEYNNLFVYTCTVQKKIRLTRFRPRVFSVFSSDNLLKSSQKIQVGSGFRKKTIPDPGPGVKKAPDHDRLILCLQYY
jgi:hypothetical protein